MPGILPMKVIKVGSSAQSRIAQACDRCRSKKIRCDGIRPSCTQCINVGFECKTSDKLSRRAFPRGYTESLEERVRALELEVRELKDLLDEKDEKIDLLSRLHPSHSPRLTSSPIHHPTDPPTPTTEKREESQEKDDTFKLQQSPLLMEDDNGDSYFAGLSSGHTLVDAFKLRVQGTQRPCSEIRPDSFFRPRHVSVVEIEQNGSRIVSWKAPPRMVSDQMINIFFQEWAPLFPVLHRPTFLTMYERYVANIEEVTDRNSLALLNLVFSIGALSCSSRDSYDIASFELQWEAAIQSLFSENSLQFLQCLVLAQIHCMLSADYAKLLKYKGLATSLLLRLGLNQSQKRFALGALTIETRKKVFWTQYTVDCLSAAQLGLPRMIKEDNIHCEYPVDADDEHVTETGFLSTLPGESTKVSSALALFKAARILSRVLGQSYPTCPSHDISFRTMASQAEELDSWYNNLAAHLRLKFAQDKPSANVTGSRSPILAIMYHYVRSLIFRPAVCASLGPKSYSATLAVGHSSKSIVQIIQLLDERNLSFSLALNRNELTVLAGFGLLFQTLHTEHDGRLVKDSQKMTLVVVDLLKKAHAPYATSFRRIGYSMLASLRPTIKQSPPLSRHNSDSSMGAPSESAFSVTQRHIKALASRFPSISRTTNNNDARRATLPNIGILQNNSSTSINSLNSNLSGPMSRSEPTLSPVNTHTPKQARASTGPRQTPNLDFLSFDNTPIPSSYEPTQLIHPQKQEVSTSDWERLLGSLDNGTTNIYDTIYGGVPAEALVDAPIHENTWTSDLWLNGLGNPPIEHIYQPSPAVAQSVLSLSDESLTSGEEYCAELRSVGSSGRERFGSIVIPDMSSSLPLETNYGL
ncbi:hypothetical protein EJ05DRAFT_485457 [Pseudovirgaria hyperparasitica]|uniref:Zn(2)-C6 fungal-type domain-containing protein n=1 Tax=Pseudovirgaria hyperparasitica TaxID=470096 RepID=A0A6A6W8U8_9PEZI|nr:uncharacterized protein EJ05DRAFT_485457 [Pseudovirgaria hyperparasitica]KAF2758316.1 hypothetical protein EJ05DRAFT_485457 [Pseudovirgaria hyperparasitica]